MEIESTPAFNALYAAGAMPHRFKVLFAVLIFTLTGISFTSDSAQSVEAADRAAIKAVLDAHGAAWTRGDVAAAVATLTEDADWVSGGGTVLVGRDAIAAMHREMLEGPAKGTRHSHPGIPNIRFITREVAIVDGDSYMAGFHDAHGKELPAEHSRYTAVFVKKNGNWYVTAFRSLPQVKLAPRSDAQL
jgi:uncharacterized protein (TIGR02246 family)